MEPDDEIAVFIIFLLSRACFEDEDEDQLMIT